MDILGIIKVRRSIRRFKSDPVPLEALIKLLEAARWAPSWSNTQCWRFIVVTDLELKRRMAEVLASNRGALAAGQAPIIIVTCAETGRAGYMQGQKVTDKDEWYMFDVASALENLLLTACSLGLGTLHIGNFDPKKIEEMLDVPDGFRVVVMTLVGYSDEEPEPPARREIAEITFRDRFSNPFL